MMVSHSCCFTCCIVDISSISGFGIEEKVQTDLIEINVQNDNNESGRETLGVKTGNQNDGESQLLFHKLHCGHVINFRIRNRGKSSNKLDRNRFAKCQ